MKGFLKRLSVFAGLALAFGVFFHLYSRFLVDASLENLELALSVTREDSEVFSPADRAAFRSVIEDLTLEEMSGEKANFENVAFLEMALHSFEQDSERAGSNRAKLYLDYVKKAKQEGRHPVLRVADALYYQIEVGIRSAVRFKDYLIKKWFPQLQEFAVPTAYADLLLIEKAEAYEREGRYEKAEKIYRSYLDQYAGRSDTAGVSISLAHVLIKQEKYDPAKALLEEVRVVYAGRKESVAAAALLKKAASLQGKESLIARLREESVEKGGRDPSLEFKLALAYLSSYRLSEARKIFKTLENVQDAKIRRRAGFYLGWLAKFTADYDESFIVFLRMLEEEGIEKEFELALKAQLAGMYSKKKETHKALAELDSIAQKVKEEAFQKERSRDAWLSLAEVEKANLYFFDLKDPDKGRETLVSLGQTVSGAGGIAEITRDFEQSNPLALRDRAFKALAKRRIQEALDLFKRYLKLNPQDGWSFSGLATIDLLMGKLDTALERAQQGYHLQGDDYTASVLAYVYGHLGRYSIALDFYEEALRKNPSYLPALFNRACIYLRQKQYAESLKHFTALYKAARRVEPIIKAKILNNMGHSLWHLGYPELALKRFQTALKVMPDYETARANIKVLQAP